MENGRVADVNRFVILALERGKGRKRDRERDGSGEPTKNDVSYPSPPNEAVKQGRPPAKRKSRQEKTGTGSEREAEGLQETAFHFQAFPVLLFALLLGKGNDPFVRFS